MLRNEMEHEQWVSCCSLPTRQQIPSGLASAAYRGIGMPGERFGSRSSPLLCVKVDAAEAVFVDVESKWFCLFAARFDRSKGGTTSYEVCCMCA